ncbi:hexokinase-4-like [Littorina saxatilis]|uniref:hexokinase-4-like n=1 Tax=Littorina saxatilis TaxID=31220 RepID=UPI0038B67850
MVSSVGVLVFLRRRRAKRSRSGKHVGLTEIPESNKPLNPEPDMPIIPEKRSKVETLLGNFQLTNTKLQNLMTVLDQEMCKGLNGAPRSEADIKMFPTFVRPLSGGSGKGNLLVLDLGNTHLKASLVNLEGTNAQILWSLGYPIPDDKECGTVGQLFDFMADCTNAFIKEENLSGKIPLALIVGFPCKHTSVGKDCLVKWTKEVRYSGTDHGDLYTLLLKAVDRRAKQKSGVPRSLDNLRKLKIAAFVNDAVSTLVSVAFNNSDCKIGLVVDSGFNACYVEDWTHVEMDNTADKNPREMIINTELGALGENGCLDFFRTAYDKELDEYSSSPGTQILEKMVGGRYIGEIVRLVLKRMTQTDLLFGTVPLTCDLFRKDNITTGCVIIIEGDTKEPHKKTSGVLDGLGVTYYTDDDLKTVRLVCRAVCERAAYLAAASLATLVNHINQPEVVVVVDGYLYQNHPHFRDLMYSKTLELLDPGLKFYLESPICDRAVGAARIAAASVSSRHKQTVTPDALARHFQSALNFG